MARHLRQAANHCHGRTQYALTEEILCTLHVIADTFDVL